MVRQDPTGIGNGRGCLEASHRVDVRASASKVTVPTLVLHCTDDARIPFEQARRVQIASCEVRFCRATHS